MIEVEHEGSVYRYTYCDRTDRGYWIGISGKRSNMFNGAYCRIPLCYNSLLEAKAKSAGFSISPIRPKVAKKTVSKPRAKKQSKNTISIF